MLPTRIAKIALRIFATRKLRVLEASNGREVWPSCDMELVRSTENGTIPPAKREMKTIWPESADNTCCPSASLRY